MRASLPRRAACKTAALLTELTARVCGTSWTLAPTTGNRQPVCRWLPGQESNLCISLRRAALYPLSYQAMDPRAGFGPAASWFEARRSSAELTGDVVRVVVSRILSCAHIYLAGCVPARRHRHLKAPPKWFHSPAATVNRPLPLPSLCCSPLPYWSSGRRTTSRSACLTSQDRVERLV